MMCVNHCGGDPECRQLDCCHTCRLLVAGRCVNDGSYAYVARYFDRVYRA